MSTEKKKGIRFNEFAEVYKVVPRRSMYTADQKKEIWAEKEDYDSFKKDVRQVVQKVEQGRRGSDAMNTTWGVAHMTQRGRQERARIREQAWDVVLDEQDTQAVNGRRDSAVIAALYRNISYNSQQEAIMKAQRAAADVHDYLSTADDIEIMEKSKKLPTGRSRRRSMSWNAMEFADMMGDVGNLGDSSSSLGSN